MLRKWRSKWVMRQRKGQTLFVLFSFTQIEEVEEEAKVVHSLYDLIEDFNVPIPPEDKAAYQVNNHALSSLLTNQPFPVFTMVFFYFNLRLYNS